MYHISLVVMVLMHVNISDYPCKHKFLGKPLHVYVYVVVSSEREHIAANSCPKGEETRHKNTLLISLSVIHKLTFCYKSLVFVDRKSKCFFFFIFS